MRCQAMKQPSSLLQKMSISYLYPCSCTSHSFVRILSSPSLQEWCTMQNLGASPGCVMFTRRVALSNEISAAGTEGDLRAVSQTSYRIFRPAP